MSGKSDLGPWFVDEETDQFLAGLDLAMPGIDPPGTLWATIADSLAEASLANTEQRLDQGDWRAFAPGVHYKRLWTRRTFLLRCDPGSWVPTHEHQSFEHTVVISGELVIDDQTYRAGDYLGTPAGGTHADWTTRTGCVALVHYEAA